jgi:hypothetical protein
MKTDGHLGRCYLNGRAGDAATAFLAAAGYNFRLVLARPFCALSWRRSYPPSYPKSAS